MIRETERYPFTADTPFADRMAAGHRVRCGHELVGYYYPIDETHSIVRLVRVCCGESEENGRQDR